MLKGNGVGTPRNPTPAPDPSGESDVLYWNPDNLNVASIGRSEEDILSGCSKYAKRQLLRELGICVRTGRLLKVNRRGRVYYCANVGGRVQ